MSRFLPRLLAGFALVTLHGWYAHGQDAAVRHILYDIDNGLPRSSINDMVSDGRGYVWLATERGVIRFDGRNFLELDPPIPGFSGMEAVRIREGDRSLFVVFADSGCLSLDPERFEFKTVTRSPVADVASIPGGSLILLERNGTLVRFGRKGTVTRSKQYVEKPGLLSWHMGRLLASLPGNGLYVVDTSELSLQRRLDILPDGYYEHFIASPSELYFITQSNALRIGRDLGVDTAMISPESEKGRISYMNGLSEGRKFLIRGNRHLEEVRNGRNRRIHLPSLTNVELRKFLLMDTSHILVSTNQGLLQVNLSPEAVERIDDNVEDDPRYIRIRRRIVEGEKGRLFLTGNPYVYEWDRDKGIRRISDERISVYDALIDGDELILATEGRGLLSMSRKDGRMRLFDVPPLEALGHYLSLWRDRRNDGIYIGANDRLMRLDKGTGIPVSIPLPRKVGYIREICMDTLNGDIWLGTERGLLCLDSLFRLKADLSRSNGRLKGDVVNDLLIKTDRRQLWVAHDFGVDIVDLTAPLGSASLPSSIFQNPRVVSMLEDGRGRVWMGTYSGIVGYDKEKVAFYRLGRNNDLANLEFNHKSATRLSDGRLIFGGLNGYDIIDPDGIGFMGRDSRGMLTGIHRFVASDTVFQAIADDGTVSFDTESESLRIYVSSTPMMDASKHTYEYRIGDGRWIAMQGPSHIDIVRLDPGTYRLEVRGFDEYGNLIDFSPISIEATQPFVKSRLFLILVTVVVLGVLTLFILTLLRSRRQERELKERISMDLHDEVGTTLTRALYVARMGDRSKADNRLIAYLNESLFSLRAYINTMNNANFTFRQMTDEIRELSQSLVNMTGFEAVVGERTDADYLVKGELYRDVKLCLYEIVNNALKYSKGSTIRVDVTAEKGRLRLRVRDDGVLEHPSHLERKGNGLRNLAKRARKHDGHVEFDVPGPGTGLQVSLEFPL